MVTIILISHQKTDFLRVLRKVKTDWGINLYHFSYINPNLSHLKMVTTSILYSKKRR